MTFTQALVEAHSTEKSEQQLVDDIHGLLDLLDQGQDARDKIALCSLHLREHWGLSVDEVEDLFDHVDEFRQIFVKKLRETG